MLRYFAAVAFVLGATPVIAQNQSNQNVDLNEKEATRVICRSEEEAGSRLARKRVCLTAHQWKERERLEKEAVTEVQRGGRVQ
jgi:hypothetical protein